MRVLWAFLCGAVIAGSAWAAERVPSPQPSAIAPERVQPALQAILKPNIYKRMMENHEVMVYARLEDVAGTKNKKYSFYATMLVRAGLAQVRGALLNYSLYPKMISYMERADFNPKTQILTVEGGLWNYRLRSMARMEEWGGRWMHFRCLPGGHFPGLTGDVFFEPRVAKGLPTATAVYFRGELEADAASWPPGWVVERGAEIVFGFIGGRMRSYIESQKQEAQGEPRHDHEVPQPRRHY